jgi:hypothetical protein
MVVEKSWKLNFSVGQSLPFKRNQLITMRPLCGCHQVGYTVAFQLSVTNSSAILDQRVSVLRPLRIAEAVGVGSIVQP